MLEVVVWQARGNSILQKNGTFLDGELYFGRFSKDGKCYVVRSEEGYWIPIERYDWAYSRNKLKELFNRKATIYMHNRKRLNEIINVEWYLNSDNCKKWYYNTLFRDSEYLKKLYS